MLTMQLMVSFLSLVNENQFRRLTVAKTTMNHPLQILLYGTRNGIEQYSRRIDDLDSSNGRYILADNVSGLRTRMQQPFARTGRQETIGVNVM